MYCGHILVLTINNQCTKESYIYWKMKNSICIQLLEANQQVDSTAKKNLTMNEKKPVVTKLT